MNALGRHLGQVFGATSLYDFVSQLAAYTSPVLTVLADELRPNATSPSSANAAIARPLSRIPLGYRTAPDHSSSASAISMPPASSRMTKFPTETQPLVHPARPLQQPATTGIRLRRLGPATAAEQTRLFAPFRTTSTDDLLALHATAGSRRAHRHRAKTQQVVHQSLVRSLQSRQLSGCLHQLRHGAGRVHHDRASCRRSAPGNTSAPSLLNAVSFPARPCWSVTTRRISRRRRRIQPEPCDPESS